MASNDVKIYKYKDLPKKKFSERHGVNNLANVKLSFFRFMFPNTLHKYFCFVYEI